MRVRATWWRVCAHHRIWGLPVPYSLAPKLAAVRATVSLRAVPATGARHSATARSEIDRRSPCSAMYATAVASIPEPPRQSMAVIDYAERIRPRGAISHVSFGNMFFGHASLTPPPSRHWVARGAKTFFWKPPRHCASLLRTAVCPESKAPSPRVWR